MCGVDSEMSVGPTRGLAERGPPFFRHTLLDGGVGVYPEPARSHTPCTQPGGEVIALRTQAACQMVVMHTRNPWCYWVYRITIYYTLLKSIQSADAIDLQSERCASASDCGNIGISAVFGLLELDNCPGDIASLFV